MNRNISFVNNMRMMWKNMMNIEQTTENENITKDGQLQNKKY